mgnify:CR=1 FL=1
MLHATEVTRGHTFFLVVIVAAYGGQGRVLRVEVQRHGATVQGERVHGVALALVRVLAVAGVPHAHKPVAGSCNDKGQQRRQGHELRSVKDIQREKEGKKMCGS